MRTVKTPLIRKPVRRMTICCKASCSARRKIVTLFPVLRLSGKWLRDCGFRPGHVVEVACKKGRLCITIAKEQKYEALQERD